MLTLTAAIFLYCHYFYHTLSYFLLLIILVSISFPHHTFPVRLSSLHPPISFPIFDSDLWFSACFWLSSPYLALTVSVSCYWVQTCCFPEPLQLHDLLKQYRVFVFSRIACWDTWEFEMFREKVLKEKRSWFCLLFFIFLIQ